MKNANRSSFFPSFCSTQRILKKKGENHHSDEAAVVSGLQLAVSPAALFTHHHIQKRPDLSHVPFHQSWGSLPRVTGQPRQTARRRRLYSSRIPLRRKVDLLGLVRGLMGPLGSYHYFTRCRPFQVGVKQSMKLFMALSNHALLIHQGVLCENGVDEIF